MAEVLVLGVRLPNPPASYELQKIAVSELFTKLAGKIFTDVIPNFKVLYFFNSHKSDYTLLNTTFIIYPHFFKVFIRPGALRGQLMPPIEVKFDTPQDADVFRKGATQRVSVLLF